MDLSLIEKDPAAFAAMMMAKPHGSAFTPPIHDDGADIDGAWCRAHDAAVEALSRSVRAARRWRRVLVDGRSLHLRTEVALACCAAKNAATRQVPPRSGQTYRLRVGA